MSVDAALKMIVTLGVVVPTGTGTSGAFPAIVPSTPAP